MTPLERSALVERAFGEALALPANERSAFIAARCSTDPELRADLESLLAHLPDSDAEKRTTQMRHWLAASSIEGSSPEANTSAPDWRGREIGPYTVIDLIAEGGMGAVYHVNQQRPIRRDLALKVVRAGANTREIASRFRSEQQTLALMAHENIARIYDAGLTDDGLPYFAMEYFPGEPITRYCDRHRLSIRERLELFLDVCAAVQHAHQKGVIHRDLKPGNILVRAGGARALVKVIDFGIAKALQADLIQRTSATVAGQILGTPHYMSPEQLVAGDAQIDTRSDVYSLGVVLYELLTGVLAVEIPSLLLGSATEIAPPSHRLRANQEALVDAAAKRRSAPQPLLRELRSDLDWIALRALEPDPARRYPSVSEFGADLSLHLAGAPVLARPPSFGYRAKKFVARNKLLVATASAGLAVLVGGLIGTTSLYLENRRTSELAVKQRDDILRLSDGLLLDQLEAEADSLWPPLPSLAPRIESWLQGPLAQLLERRSLHSARLASIDAELAGEAKVDVDRRRELEFQQNLSSNLLDRLETFLDPDPRIGALSSMRARLDFAKTIEQRSLRDAAPTWRESIMSISDSQACPAYGGLEITPQLGLVPIGRDDSSGLWEFAHLQSGDIPARDADGRLRITDRTGVVLVLLPGGTFFMGAERAGPGRPASEPNVSEMAEARESPVHQVRLEPFFLSKYELTQGQWARLFVDDPSQTQAGTRWRNYPHVHDLRYPIESMGWERARTAVVRLGLRLPTEAQWEYGARGGRTTSFHWGPSHLTGRFEENVADSSVHRSGKAYWPSVPWDDGYPDSSPVGAFRENPFGLHDVLGNVHEWCEDRFGAYDQPVRPGDGLRLGEVSDERVCRGGHFSGYPNSNTVSKRLKFLPESARTNIGVRPARPVDR